MDSSGQQRMAARDGGSSARRRRERRLRAQWRVEQLAVAVALAVATTYSAQRSELRDPNEALRGQKTASAAGKRLGALNGARAAGGKSLVYA